jgi:hypothetical protein
VSETKPRAKFKVGDLLRYIPDNTTCRVVEVRRSGGGDEYRVSEWSDYYHLTHLWWSDFDFELVEAAQESRDLVEFKKKLVEIAQEYVTADPNDSGTVVQSFLDDLGLEFPSKKKQKLRVVLELQSSDVEDWSVFDSSDIRTILPGLEEEDQIVSYKVIEK